MALIRYDIQVFVFCTGIIVIHPEIIYDHSAIAKAAESDAGRPSWLPFLIVIAWITRVFLWHNHAIKVGNLVFQYKSASITKSTMQSCQKHEAIDRSQRQYIVWDNVSMLTRSYYPHWEARRLPRWSRAARSLVISFSDRLTKGTMMPIKPVILLRPLDPTTSSSVSFLPIV